MAVSHDATRWSLEPPAVRAEVILRLQKYHDLACVPAAIREAADAVAAEARRLVSPEAVVWRGPVTAVDPAGTVTLAGTHRFSSRALAKLLASAADAYVVVLTLGGALEERVDALFQERLLLEGLLLDTAGWAAIEALMRQIRGRLRALERSAGRAVTHRLAPGYLDWSVAEQAALLGVFGEAPLPVRVTEAAWMLPRKSVSALFGVLRAG